MTCQVCGVRRLWDPRRDALDRNPLNDDTLCRLCAVWFVNVWLASVKL